MNSYPNWKASSSGALSVQRLREGLTAALATPEAPTRSDIDPNDEEAMQLEAALSDYLAARSDATSTTPDREDQETDLGDHVELSEAADAKPATLSATWTDRDDPIAEACATADVLQDEVDVHLNPRIGSCWMPKGKQAEVVTPGKNEKRHVASSARCRCWRPINRRFEPQFGRGNPGVGIITAETIKIYSAIDTGWRRIVKMATVTSLDRLHVHAIWGIRDRPFSHAVINPRLTFC